MKKIFKYLAAVIAVTILATSCQTTDTSWVYSLNGDVMPAGVYITFLLGSYEEAVDKLQQKQDEELEALRETMTDEEYDEYEFPEAVYDMESKEIYKMQLDGISVTDWIVQNTAKTARQYYAIREKMKEMGVSLSSEQLAQAASAAESTIKSYPDFYNANGISENSLNLIIQHEYAKEHLFHLLYEPGGEFEVSEDELKTYFAEKISQIQVMYFQKVKEYNLTDEQLADSDEAAIEALLTEKNAELKSTAEKYMTRLGAGEAIEVLNFEYEHAVALAEVEGTDDVPNEVTMPEDGDLDLFVTREYADYYGEELVNAAFDTPNGGVALVEDEYFYYVLRRVDILEDPATLEDYRESLLHELRFDTDYLPRLEEWASALKIEANQASLKRYVPSVINYEA